MIDLAMIWRRDDPKQPAIEAILEGAKYYRQKNGSAPNFVNVPPGFLTEAELAKLRERWTVATNAPAFFRNDIWLGVMTPPAETTPLRLPPNSKGGNLGGEKTTAEGKTQ